MIYLSQIVNRKITVDGKPFGKVVDFAVSHKGNADIEKIIIQKDGKKYAIPKTALEHMQNKWIVTDKEATKTLYDEKNLCLVEDVLDKQVIDVNGRRVVRVNDVLFHDDKTLAISGIDIGLSGVLRRLGLSELTNMRTVTLPWSVIEAFDYQTGDIQIKVSHEKLNTLHPAEIADILEQVGTKEREGIVEALDVQKAASAIEEADPETQSAILEQVSSSRLKNIVQKMHVSELADILDQLNPFTSKQILKEIGVEKANKVKRLLVFPDDVAGGLMDPAVYTDIETATVEEAITHLRKSPRRPEAIVIIQDENKFSGTVMAKNLITADPSHSLKELITHKNYVTEDAEFEEILDMFAAYNLRVLPVLDKYHHVVGIITIDAILSQVQQEEEREDAI